MSQVVDGISIVDSPVSHYSRLARAAAPSGAANWIDTLRASAMARFERVGFPSRKEEEWRFTHIDPITQIVFTPGAEYQPKFVKPLVDEHGFGAEAGCELVFVNGKYDIAHSRTGHMPAGVIVQNLADAIASNAAGIQSALGRHASIEANPFVALNTGNIADGAYIFVPRGKTIDHVIHLLFLSIPGGDKTISHPRVLIVAEENSECTVVESYAGTGGMYFTNAVTEVAAAPSSRVDHTKLQWENKDAFHVATVQARLDRQAVFVTQSASIGSKLTRNDVNVILAGEYADATMNGLVLAGESQQIDNHTLLDHAAPNCPSHELYKHVLADKSTGIFKGKILVRQPAQKTDSKQTSKSLLLSDDAVMNSQPALEIYADDVKCTHGSTTGPVDEEMVFYLRSRGISLEASRHLLTYAFAADITRRIKAEPVRRKLENYMAAQHGLPQDLRITELGSHDDSARNM